MTRFATFWICCLMAFAPGLASGFSTDSSTLARGLGATTAMTNYPVVMTVIFTQGGTNALHGFFYTEEVPTGMTVMTLGVMLNGVSRTNYTVESGQDGDVYAGYTPWRWILERPAAFAESNSVPAQGTVQITYSLSSPVPVIFGTAPFTWIGSHTANTNASFGYAEAADLQTLSVVTNGSSGSVSASGATNGVGVSLLGVAGARYAIQASTNLVSWVSIATNTAPSSFTDTNAGAMPVRFYRPVWLP